MDLHLHRVTVATKGDDITPPILHVDLVAYFPDNDLTHSARFQAIVQLNDGDDFMRLSLAEIQNLAMQCLRQHAAIDR